MCPTGSEKFECVSQTRDRDEVQTVAAHAEEEDDLEWAELELWQKGVGGEREAQGTVKEANQKHVL